MAERIPARDAYDVEIDLGGASDGSGCFAYALIKFAYSINASKGRLEAMPAVPLENDIRNDSLSPRIPPHTDFWHTKQFTDVAVLGSAFTPGDRPVEQLGVAVEIGGRSKRVQVFGNRMVEWTRDGQPKLGTPEPFVTMPLGIERAYGGCDFRVPFDDQDPRSMGVTLECDYPGLYARNPWGVGYLVMHEPIEGMRLPNLEDPEDLLTHDRIITSDPAKWYQQPMPAYLDWMPVNCFPRNLFIAIECEPWFPPPEDERLKEVQRGFLPKGFLHHLKDQNFGKPPHSRFRQEASHGLMFEKELFGTEVRLTAMHPRYSSLVFQLPQAPPSVEMKIEDLREHLQPHLVSVAIYPDQEYVTLTYTVRMTSPRPFIPGIHKFIPVAVSVNGEAAVRYQPPATVKDRLAAAGI